MVLCIVVGCTKRSGRDKDVSFYRLPKIMSTRNLELSKKRRAGYLAAISRKDLTEKIMANDRICSRHFVNGKPAPLEDETNPGWLPTQNLGRCKVLGNSRQNAERWIRRKAREDVRRETDEEIYITTAESSRDNAVEGLLALASSNLSATVGSEGSSIVEDGAEITYDSGAQFSEAEITCEAVCQPSNSASSSSDVSVQTDMSCTLVSLEINKKC